MGVELTAAVLASLLTLTLVLIFGIGVIKPVGMPMIMSNREDMPKLTGWLGRAQRAHANALENLLPFAIIALAVQVSGTSSVVSQTGALVFLGARAVHAGSYLLGITGLRTLAWNVGFAATIATAIPLLSALQL